MKQFEGVLICTDLDGTLLKNDKTVSEENLQAIRYFEENGGYFTFVTGRMPYSALSIAERVGPNAPFGCINGGALYDHRTKQYLWTQPISRDVLELVEYVEQNVKGIGIQINALDRIYFCSENSAMELFRRVTGDPNITCGLYDVTDPIGKIVLGDLDGENLERAIALLAEHPRASEFDFIRSEKMLYEIMPKGVHKGVVLPVLAKHLGVDMKKTVAIGDYNNDVGMLRAAGVGIAVANAVPEAKAAADLVTVSNEEHAIARVIADLESGRLAL